MVNRLRTTLFLLVLVFSSSCRNNDEPRLTFETLEAEKSTRLSNEERSPLCSVSLKIAAATQESGKVGEKINASVAYHLFNKKNIGLKGCIEQFAENYVKTYKNNMLPLYNEDRTDSTKRQWYEFHYIITSTTEQTSRRTLVYLATVDYSEGHTNSIHQTIPLNFYSDTGDEIERNDIFVDGYETQLKPILLKALMERVEVESIGELKEKGYLQTVDIYPSENIIVGDNTITFIYNPSEIASLELGTIQLILTYAQMEKLIKPQFLQSLQ